MKILNVLLLATASKSFWDYLPIILICLGGVALLFFVIRFIKWYLSLRVVVPTGETHVVRNRISTNVYGDLKMINGRTPWDALLDEDSGGKAKKADDETSEEETPEEIQAREEKARLKALMDANAKARSEVKTKGNCYYQFPEWVPFLGVSVTKLSLSNFGITLKDYPAYDKDRVPFVVDIVAFLQLSDPVVASIRASNYRVLVEQLDSVVQSAARTILAKEDLETSIMGDRAKYGKLFTAEVEAHLLSWGVTPVKTIELMDVRDGNDSKVIANIMAKKISTVDKESRVVVARNKKEAEQAEIEAAQAIEVRKQEKDETVGKRTAEANREVRLAKEKTEQDVHEAAKTTKEKEMVVVKVGTIEQANIDKEKIIIETKASKEQMEIAAEASKRQMEINAEAEKRQKELAAEASFIEITKNAEAEKKQKELAADADLIRVTKGAEAEKKQKELLADGDLIRVTKGAEAEKAQKELLADGEYSKITKEAKANKEKLEMEALSGLVRDTKKAEGIEAIGTAEAKALELKKLAEVDPEIKLANAIGDDDGYQRFLIAQNQIKAVEAVGVAQANNLSNADIKVIATTGNGNGGITKGVSKVMDIFTPEGGMNLAGMLEAFATTEVGKGIVAKFFPESVKGSGKEEIVEHKEEVEK